MTPPVMEQPVPVLPAQSLGRLRRCDECGGVQYGIEHGCQCCGGAEMRRLTPVGEIYSYTTVTHGSEPFVLALIQLSGGPLVTAQLEMSERKLRVGMPVELAHGRTSESVSGGLFFRPRQTNYAAPK